MGMDFRSIAEFRVSKKMALFLSSKPALALAIIGSYLLATFFLQCSNSWLNVFGDGYMVHSLTHALIILVILYLIQRQKRILQRWINFRLHRLNIFGFIFSIFIDVAVCLVLGKMVSSITEVNAYLILTAFFFSVHSLLLSYFLPYVEFGSISFFLDGMVGLGFQGGGLLLLLACSLTVLVVMFRHGLLVGAYILELQAAEREAQGEN